MQHVNMDAKLGRGVPFLGVLPRLLKDPAGLALDVTRATDAVVPLRLGPLRIYLAHHPTHLRHIMLDNRHNYTKGPLFKRADLLLGNGLVLLEGEPWLHQRRLLQPPFSPKRIANIAPRVARAAMQRVNVWRHNPHKLEMGHEMAVYTLTALLRSMLGVDADAAMVEQFDSLFTCIGKHVALRGPTFFLPERLPLPGRREALAAVAELHRIIDQLVATRRSQEQQGDDLLGLMLGARDDTGRAMSHVQLRDELKTAIFAGYDSTAAGLAWTWHMLATHPESAQRVHEEVLRVCPEGEPTVQQIESLEYLGRVFQETLRLCPPFSFHPRTAIDADVIAGQHIPAGATLLYSNYAPGRHPAYWQHPDSFYPDHFLPEQVAKRDRFAYVPFAAGPRMCIGMTLALLEARMIFALALRELEIVRPLNAPVMQTRFGTTRAKGGIWVQLRARAG